MAAGDLPRCLNADARLAESYARLLGGERAQLLLSDPPYCLLTRRRRGGDLRDKKGTKLERGPVVRFESVRDYRDFTRAWLTNAVAHLLPSAPLVLWTNFLGKAPIIEAARELGYGHLAGEFRWCKPTTAGGGNEILLRLYEVALVLLKAPPAPPADGDAAVPWAVVGGYDDDAEAARFGSHPNHKPFSVLAPLVRTYSRPGELILDPFAGSGSVAEAALRLGRRQATMEIEPDWAERVTGRLRLGR